MVLNLSLDLNILEEHDITPDDFVYLYGLYKGIDLTSIPLFPNYIPLEEKEFVKHIEGSTVLLLKGKELFEPKGIDAMFLEFWTSYPIYVRNDRGQKRALRDVNSDTKQALVVKKKYESIVKGNPAVHKKIMEGLTNYIKNCHPFIVGIEVFLNQQKWNQYIGMDDKSDKSETGTTASI